MPAVGRGGSREGAARQGVLVEAVARAGEEDEIAAVGMIEADLREPAVRNDAGDRTIPSDRQPLEALLESREERGPLGLDDRWGQVDVGRSPLPGASARDRAGSGRPSSPRTASPRSRSRAFRSIRVWIGSMP